MAARTYHDQMDYLLDRGMHLFGQPVTYQRSGYASFAMTGIVDIIPHLESVNVGKFYAVSFHEKDFDLTPLTSFLKITFTGSPDNLDSVTIDGITYTWDTVLDNTLPYRIQKVPGQIIPNAAALTAAINLGAGAGTVYSTPTLRHPTCTATQVNAVCRVDYNVPGSAGNGIIASDDASNVTLSSKTFGGGTPLPRDYITYRGLLYNVTDVGFDAEHLIECRLEINSTQQVT